MGINLLIAAINKYGFGKYTYGTGNGQVVCNVLVRNALSAAGYNIPIFNTNDPKVGLFSQSNGVITNYAKKYFDVVSESTLQPGDIVLFKKNGGGSGHMGIFYSYNNYGQVMFYGSQSQGPALVYEKGNVQYWNNGPDFEIVGYLRPKPEYYDPANDTTQLFDPNLINTPRQEIHLFVEGGFYTKDKQTNQEFLPGRI